MHLADVEVAYLARGPHLRRQPVAESIPGGFESHTPVEPLVIRFVDDSHASAPDFFHDAESIRHQISGFKRIAAHDSSLRLAANQPFLRQFYPRGRRRTLARPPFFRSCSPSSNENCNLRSLSSTRSSATRTRSPIENSRCV